MQGRIAFTSHNLPSLSCSLSSSSSYQSRDSRDGISADNNEHVEKVTKSVSENAVIVIGRRGCCMCHVVKRLLLGLGVNPAVLVVDEEREDVIIRELTQINYRDDHILKESNDRVNPGGREMIGLPAVYVGGKLYGGLERVVSAHISGELVPILKDAGALWL